MLSDESEGTQCGQSKDPEPAKCQLRKHITSCAAAACLHRVSTLFSMQDGKGQGDRGRVRNVRRALIERASVKLEMSTPLIFPEIILALDDNC